jgi:FixJ family two-component response regulator
MLPSDPAVFVIDDDEAVRDALYEIFVGEGLAVCPFASAEDFLAAGGDQAVGCLVLDIHMPGLTGLELQAELRRRGMTIPAVVITGQGDVSKAVTALKGGAVDFIEKPFNVGALVMAVREALDREACHRRAAAESRLVETRLNQLSPREREVMDRVVAGDANKVIAAKLGISSRTVENHRARVMEKMACDSVSSLIHLVMRWQGG